MESTGRAAVAELVATFALIFVGAGSVVIADPTGSGLVGIALAHGIVLAVMVSVTAHISGGLVNPAVTIGLWVVGKLTTPRAGVLIAAQLVGATLGALLLKAVFPAELLAATDGGTPVLARGTSVAQGILLEGVLTFFLVFAVFGTAVDDRGPLARTAGFTIGLVLTFDILVGGPLTGASMNPARTFGPGLVSGTWTDWWVYWVGPISGALVAAMLYWGVFLRGREPATP
ncbi:MAG TPA: aquaporin [Actinomycetota bacterium]|nr:aquaporin [Actinomycetota bacterium]